MTDAASGMAGIYVIAIILAVLAPYIIMLQLGRIWHWTWLAERHLARVENHLAQTAKERKEAADRVAASLARQSYSPPVQ